MFKEVGKKIQSVGKILFALGVVIAVIIGFSAMALISEAANGGLGFLIGVLIIALGVLSSWLGVLLYVGFGRIAECVEEQNRLTRQMLGIADPSAAPKRMRTEQPRSRAGKKCPDCGKILRADAQFCNECGYQF